MPWPREVGVLRPDLARPAQTAEVWRRILHNEHETADKIAAMWDPPSFR